MEKERAWDEAKARVWKKANAVQKAAAEASQGQGRNLMLKGGWQRRMPPRSGPVTILHGAKREREETEARAKAEAEI